MMVPDYRGNVLEADLLLGCACIFSFGDLQT